MLALDIVIYSGNGKTFKKCSAQVKEQIGCLRKQWRSNRVSRKSFPSIPVW